MSNEYPIQTIADFLAVPEASIDACLADFKTWLALARDTAPINAQLNEAFGVCDAQFLMDSFTWFNDGISGIRYVDVVSIGEPGVVRVELMEVQ